MALTTRVGVSMSDNVDLVSIDTTTFMVRPVGGEAVPGKYSVQMGLVNFAPDVPQQPETRDWLGLATDRDGRALIVSARRGVAQKVLDRIGDCAGVGGVGGRRRG